MNFYFFFAKKARPKNVSDRGLTEEDLVFITGGFVPDSNQIMDSYEIYTG